MSIATAALLALSALLPQQGRQTPSLRLTAERGSNPEVRAAVRRSPPAAREAVDDLLVTSARGRSDASQAALAAADRLASALAAEVGDSFPTLQVRRFRNWTASERRHKLRIDSLRRAGNTALGREGFAAAVTAWRASAHHAEALRDTAGVAAALGNIGTGFYRQGLLDSAVAYFGRAQTLAWQAGDRRTALNALGAQANVLRDRGDLTGALRLYGTALQLRERIGDVRGMVADRNNMGTLAEWLGDLDAARDAHIAALELSRHHSMREPEAANLVNLGRLSALEADYPTAGGYYRSAQFIYRELGDRRGEALALRHVGQLALRRGDYPAARARLAEAVARYEELDVPAAAAEARAELAEVYAAMGDPAAAEVQADSAEAAARRAGASGSTLARVSLARAGLALEFGDYAGAERHYRSAESRFRDAGDERGRADSRHGLGYLMLLKQEPGPGATLLALALQGFEAAGDRRAAALARLDLASAQAAAGPEGRAMPLLLAARESLRVVGDPVAEAAALVALGDLALEGGRPVSAAAHYRDGLATLEDRPAATLKWRLHAGLGDALAAQLATGPAAAAYAEAIRVVEQGAMHLPAEHLRAAYRADKGRVFERLAALELTRGRPAEAFSLSERLRARELLDVLARGSIAWKSGADSSFIRREQDLRRAITVLAGRLGPGLARPTIRGVDPARLAAPRLREALLRAETEYAAVLDSLRERQPGYARLVSQRASSVEDVAAALPGDAALLEFLVGDSSATLFVVTRRAWRAVPLRIDRNEVATLVGFVRGALAQPVSAGTVGAHRAPLRRLHQALIRPAESTGLLRGVRRLVIVPHRELHYLPFAALVEDPRGGRFLVERYEISVVPSASVWLALTRTSAAGSSGRVVALAPESGTLAGADAEVRAIGRIMGARALVLTGARASKRALRDAVTGADIVHFATFGVLNRRNPLFSHLALAPGSGEDGRLEVHEVYGLALDARLVVLSACETALGSGSLADVPPGDDWVGLSQAFLAAGARRVIATLWPVEDMPTADLMTWFYEGIARGWDEGRALADAQRRAIRTARTAHPYLWAGFSLVGGP